MKLRDKPSRPVGYSRYSTEEQHHTSIPDQFAGQRRHLSRIGISAKIDELSDAEMSGELVSRPGINELRNGIREGRWDLLICEDSSRLFRHDTAAIELIHTAVDAGMRVICINDSVDTSEDGWEDRLSDSVKHHARTNRHTSQRIKRRLESLFTQGGAIGLLQPGYTRVCSVPATARTPEEGPFFDHVDPLEAPLIKEAFQRVARQESVWAVAEWLTAQNLRKSGLKNRRPWKAKDVIALIRREKYRGIEYYRKTISKKKFTSGEKVSEPNDPKSVLSRDMPHLRIVDDAIWYAANAAIDARCRRTSVPSGKDHPLAGIPRDSRGPLSEVFFCFCGEKMYADGRNGGGYRCRGAKHGTCWNLATCVRGETHAAISQAIASQLLEFRGTVDFLVQEVESRFLSEASRKDVETTLVKRIAELTRRRDRTVRSIESSDEPPEVLAKSLAECIAELAIANGELERSQSLATLAPRHVARAQIEKAIDTVQSRILSFGRDTGGLLKSLIPNGILAVPYQQFGSNKIVLRAEFELDVLSELPDHVSRILSGDISAHAMDFQLIRRQCRVNLFQPSGIPKYAFDAYRLSGENTHEEIGELLGIPKTLAGRAVRMGKAMTAEGVADPFVRVTERPAAASRWRFGVSA